MPYHLFIKIDNENVRPFYESAIEKFNNSKVDYHRDSGFDLFVSETSPNLSTTNFNTSEMTKKPIVINHNVACAVYKEMDSAPSVLLPSGFYMYPRSSISKTKYRLANSVGIIDAGYRGHLIAKVDCIHNWYQSELESIVNVGDRLFQVCTPDLSPFKSVTIVEVLNSTVRGTGGFGSTG
jgi:dUTP pyrophosphatase